MKKMTEAFFAFSKANKALLICFIITFFSGLILGVFVLRWVPDDVLSQLKNNTNNFFSIYEIQTVGRKDVFYQSFRQNILPFMYIWLSGMFIVLIPVAFLQVFLKGVRLGFSVGYFCSVYSGMGILFSTLELFFGNAVLLTVMILYSVYCVRFSREMYKMRNSRIKTSKGKFYINSLMCLLFVFFIVAGVSFFNSYILSEFIKLF